MSTIYELTQQAAQLYELLTGGEIDEQTFADTLEAIGVDEKAETYCKIIRQLLCDAEDYKKEIDRLTVRKRSAEANADRMKSALLALMQMSGQSKIKAGSFAVSTATSQAVSITNESRIPAQYLIPQPPKVDKTAIKDAIKAGETVDGAEIVINTGIWIR